MSLSKSRFLALALLPALIFATACEDRNPTELEIARADTDPLIFDDAWGGDIYFQPFFETHYTAVTTDSVFAYDGFAPDGAKSLKVEVPPLGSALGPYAGGVFTPTGARDLTDYNALTFYVRTDAEGVALNTVGFGNDNTGTSRYEASRSLPPIQITQEWVQRVVPIPDPSKLISERGLFLFAEGADEAHPNGYNIWFDEIRFEKLDDINIVISQLSTIATRRYFIGTTVGAGGGTTIFSSGEGNVRVDHSSRYYKLMSSFWSVARPTPDGEIEIVGEGETIVTAKLLDADVRGALTLNGYAAPTVPAPLPTQPANEVVSLLSAAYTNEPVTTWRADWEGVTTQVQDFDVGGRLTKMYYDLNYVGIDMLSQPVDASGMDYFHIDVYAPEGTQFEVVFESHPAGGASETASVVLRSDTTPAFVPGGWSSLDIPLTDFQVSETWDWGRIAILTLAASADVQLVLVDNLYWHK